MATESVETVHVAEFDNDGRGDEAERAVYGSLQRVSTMGLWVSFAEQLNIALQRSKCWTVRKGELQLF